MKLEYTILSQMLRYALD